MKKLSLTFCVMFFFLFSINAQFTNTKWVGEVNSSHPMSVLMDFRTDTVTVYMLPDTMLMEKLVYKIDNNVLIMNKSAGSSPCNSTMIAKYNFQIKADEMTLDVIDDPCIVRARMVNKESYIKVK